MAGAVIDAVTRKKVLRVLFISLLLDLISFTFILPLFPSLLDFYRTRDKNPSSTLNQIFYYLNAYKKSFSIPVNSKYDIVLLGGALGSLFSLLQAIASPLIGRFSDKNGRRTALLYSMCGNILSVALWCMAVDFRTFLLSRIVGGLSEGNVQLAIAIATDVSTEQQRGSTLALVGACFSIAFTFGPALGAFLSSITIIAANPFATAAGVSLFLIVVETVYLYLALPETLPQSQGSLEDHVDDGANGHANGHANGRANGQANGKAGNNKMNTSVKKATKKPYARKAKKHTNAPWLLNAIHFLYLLPFSGMEFSLPFFIASVLFPTHASPSKMNGRVLGLVGLIAALLQGSVVRRLPPLTVVKTGLVACTIAFFALIKVESIGQLYGAAAVLAIPSATVVTGLNSLGSFEARETNRGEVLGALRSWGQLGRALGPIVFCSLFWWAGRETAYLIGGSCMLAVTTMAFVLLRSPPIVTAAKAGTVKK